MSPDKFITLSSFCSQWEKWEFPGCGWSQGRHICVVRQTVLKYPFLSWLERESEWWLISYRLIRNQYLPNILNLSKVGWTLHFFFSTSKMPKDFTVYPPGAAISPDWMLGLRRGPEVQKVPLLIYLLDSPFILLFILGNVFPLKFWDFTIWT